MAGARRMLWVALAVGSVASAGSPDPIGACVAKLNPDIDVGYERIAARCPELVRRLNGRYAAWLPPDWRRPGNDLSAGGLRELRESLAGAPALGPRLPRVASLPPVLAELVQADSEHNSWWARTRAWLRHLFARGKVDEPSSWLPAESRLPEGVLEVISYMALLLVVLLAVAIVANELRVNGVLKRRVRVKGVVAPTIRTVWSEAPLQEQPRLLLEWLVTQRAGGVASGLTARELVRNDPELRELAVISEQVRFSGVAPSEAAIRAALKRGQALIA